MELGFQMVCTVPRGTSSVLAFYVLHGRGRGSGAEVAMPVALLTRWREGLIVYMRGYARREDA